MTSTVIDIPEDPEAGDWAERQPDAWRIYRFLRERSGQFLRTWEVADALDIHQGFSTRLADARGIARRHNELITNCEMVDGEWMFKHITDQDETDAWFTGARIRAKVITGTIANHVGQVEWGARNGHSPLKKHWARVQCNIDELYLRTQHGMSELSAAIEAQDAQTP